jgi:predicted nuclease of predicted toxin-antitoxin system
MRFLVDENLPPSLAPLLVAAGHVVYLVKGSDLEAESDEVISEFAAAEHWVVMTMDLDYPVRGASQLPGLVLLRPGRYVTASDLERLVRDFLAEDLSLLPGRIAVVSPGNPTRWRSLDDA